MDGKILNEGTQEGVLYGTSKHDGVFTKGRAKGVMALENFVERTGELLRKGHRRSCSREGARVRFEEKVASSAREKERKNAKTAVKSFWLREKGCQKKKETILDKETTA